MLEYLKEHLPKFATGGLIQLRNGGKLPGYGGGDRNLALLEDGEFVIRKEAVKAFGADLFSALNSLKLPKFATGGAVGQISGGVNKGGEVVNVNINFPDGKSFSLYGDEEVVKALKRQSKIYK